MSGESLSVIIATKDRFEELRVCTRSIARQDTLPEEVVIIDDGDLNEVEQCDIIAILPDSVDVFFSESEGPSGLSVARNTGVRIASGDILVFFDDDAEIGSNYLSKVKDWYTSIDDPNFVGVGGFDNRLRKKSKLEVVLRNIFLHPTHNWKINCLGMQGWNSRIKEAVRSNWMEGNNFSYKKNVLLDHPFPQYNGGRETLEDIAIGWKLKKENKYSIIDPELEINHYEASDEESAFETGEKEGMNRVRYFRTYGNKIMYPPFYWAMLGQILMQIAYGLSSKQKVHHITKGIGIGYGLIRQSFRKTDIPDF